MIWSYTRQNRLSQIHSVLVVFTVLFTALKNGPTTLGRVSSQYENLGAYARRTRETAEPTWSREMQSTQRSI